MSYLEALAPLLAPVPTRPCILLGDLNQRIPRVSQPERAYSALFHAMTPEFAVATAGVKDATGRAAIDHPAHTSNPTAEVIGKLPGEDPKGLKLSDHFGLVLDIYRTDQSSGAC